MDVNANAKYKASLFSFLFKEPERRIELYNALTGVNLPPDTPIQDATLPDVLFMDRVNDVAFVVGGKLVVLIEHQSTINNNMPLRLLIYIARVYETLIVGDDIYRGRLIPLPRPEFFVLYNGVESYPDIKTLRLSDAFMEAPEVAAGLKQAGLLELEVNVINVNAGRNEPIVRKSEYLSGYAAFVDRVREYRSQGMELSKAIKKAVSYCLRCGILMDTLPTISTEMINLLTAEFDLETAKRVWREEALEEGMEKGMEKGREEGREEGMEKGREEGREEGMEKGREEGAIMLVERMLKRGRRAEDIAADTDMPLSWIISLKERLSE